MAFTKFANAEVLDIKGSAERRGREASLSRLSDFHDYRTDDGYMYVRIRSISSRTNKNNDGWPTAELAGGPEAWERMTSERQAGEGFTVEANKDQKFGYSTHLYKPIFVDHNNHDPSRARGVIVDSKFRVLDSKTAAEDHYWNSDEADPEHLPPSEVELLLEIDAKSFPKLAKAIKDGDIDGFSMGCDVEYSKCSHCGHKASSPDEYCSHIKQKGRNFTVESGKHAGRSRKSYENCYGIKFFEISAVFDPADPTALAREVIDEQPQKKEGSLLRALAMNKVAEPELPQSMHTTAPEDVDTLRTERVCPICGNDMDADKCDVCGYEAPPESLQNPDLDKAKANDFGEDPTAPVGEGPELDEQAEEATDAEKAQQPGSLLTNNPQPTSAVKVEMRSWAPKIKHGSIATPKLAGGDEPEETVISDQTQPVTSAFRTAKELIAAAKKRNPTGENMSDQRTAAEPVPAAKPDKRVDVTGVGGVIQDNNVDASKPEGAHSWEPKGVTVDVTGKGGVLEDSNEEATKPSAGKESLPSGEQNNAGFQSGGQTGPNTQTWHGTEGQKSPVTDKAFPTSSAHDAAKQGVKPIGGPDVQPERRENLEQDSGFTNTQKTTDQWTGTGGNGVTRQQNPVTRKSINSGFVSVAALKLAEDEVEVGLLPKEKKLDRIMELSELSDEELAAEQRVVARVKTAGLGKQAATRTASQATRLPSFRQATHEDAAKPAPIDDGVLDSAIFGR